MITSNWLEFEIHNLNMSIGDMVGVILTSEQQDHYQRISRMRDLYLDALLSNWPYPFDWRRASDVGWLSKSDYSVFKAELKGLTCEESVKAYREKHGQDKK